ncbi:RING-H2 finger protein ATL39 [Brachypodium distachyon]|uniref:RING-type E3 ubiquitin transferase n=1 Tax=Brachypodium distachyon TaxID=15368 RepID=I1HKR5_BRADI|nr:RING-H2 finger protein ATL39 [Brachypodium distachyon]KQK06948.1 hypothetical protein BRADI_2g31670v3 [Brachypodium distachyon]|eukprot:XP_024314579.1 RING-H2 finger protein ATL39 [Brachypodium distachyon]
MLFHRHRGDGAPEPPPSPYDDDRDHSLVVLLTFGIFFSFVVLYLVAGLVWASAIAAFAVALSVCYLRARRRAALARLAAAAGVGGRARLARSSSGGLDNLHLRPAALLLPAFAYKRGAGEAAGSPGWAQCVICIGLVQAGEMVRRLPACKHLFHAECIDTWLRSHSTCPICRAVVVDGRSSQPPV